MEKRVQFVDSFKPQYDDVDTALDGDSNDDDDETHRSQSFESQQKTNRAQSSVSGMDERSNLKTVIPLPLFVPSHYSFLDDTDVAERYIAYDLNVFQRVFVALEDPDSCLLAKAISMFMLFVIIVSCVNYVIATLSELKQAPNYCSNPACDHGEFCPDSIICEPIAPLWSSQVELICVAIFTIEYGVRILFCPLMPNRLIGILPSMDSEEATKSQLMEQMLVSDNDVFKFAKDTLVKNRTNRGGRTAVSTEDSYSKGVSKSNFTDDKAADLDNGSNDEGDDTSSDDSESIEYSWARKLYVYFFSALNVIDLLAILPFYVQLATGSSGSSISVIRVLRLCRVFRLFKVSKSSVGLKMVVNTMVKASNALAIVCFFVTLGVVFFGSLVYFFEGGVYSVTLDFPDGAYLRPTKLGKDREESPFVSIVESMYFAVVTSTTCGYGDLYPTTLGGRIISIICMYYGVILMALPITVIGNTFSQEFEKQGLKGESEITRNCFEQIGRAIFDDALAMCSGEDVDATSSYFKMQRLLLVTTFLDGTKRDALKLQLNELIQEEHRRMLNENMFLKRGSSVANNLNGHSVTAAGLTAAEYENSILNDDVVALTLQQKMQMLTDFLADKE